MPIKRVHLRPTIEPEAGNITMDIPLNNEGLFCGKAVFFGSFGGLGQDSDHVYPFILRHSGELDFGTSHNIDMERDGFFQRLAERPFIVDELFTVTLDNEDTIYRVVRVTNASDLEG